MPFLPILAAFSLLLTSVASQAADIGVADDVLADFQTFLTEAPPGEEQVAETVTDFIRPSARRDVVEVVLAIQALRLGGYKDPITLQPMPNYGRLLQQLENGALDMSGSGVWRADLASNDTLAASAALIPDGQFFAGFYTRANHPVLQETASLSVLQGLRGVSNQHWKPDWKALESLDLKGLYHVTKWQSMVRMVSADRADFLLAPFQPGTAMQLDAYGQTLLPLQGIKIALAGTRVLAVSAADSDSKARRSALDTGLAILIDNGTLRRAYQGAGLYPKQTVDWTIVNKP